HPARREVHRSQYVVLRVRDVERFVGEGQPLWLLEVRLFGGAITQSGLATSDDPSHLAVEACLDDAVMTGVGHEQTAADLIAQELPRKEERRRGRRLLTGKPERPTIEAPGGLELGDHLADEAIEGLELELAFVLADHLAARVDEHQRRPRAHGIRLPHT